MGCCLSILDDENQPLLNDDENDKRYIDMFGKEMVIDTRMLTHENEQI